MNPRIKSVNAANDYQLLLGFTNGEHGLYNCKPLLDFGVFKELSDINYFKQVAVTDGTVTWPNEQDICPDTLYLDSKKMDEIEVIWYQLIDEINSDKACSSEKALVFHFAWKLKESYKDRINLDFEKTCFISENEEKFSDGTFLDLYAVLDDKKIGFEFKFPKSTEDQKKTRIKIINDIKRLCWLKIKGKIDKGYFLCMTDTMPYINKGEKEDAVDFETYQGSIYTAGGFFPVYEKLSIEKIAVPKEIVFYWNGIRLMKMKYKPMKEGRYYPWLTPIII
ncbi:DUF2442 domain-containing protein [Methylovulum psychrotolerans]|uniref:DUF2442 domain-containing protein n=1 Tax=Methylovulum psychrotolerans TaxID=1704499 RepID=UPI001BFFAEAA|nr:DUF2442 domain-containing protein [Methylovulum psychrotolerans]MBT9097242.1 DUF2442 domain-containing protein [Methylovulum psychrotolerans]